MDSFEFNKIAGAVLGTALFVMALSIVSEMIYEPAAPAKPGYVIAIAEPERAPAGGAGGESVAPIAARLQTASATSGLGCLQHTAGWVPTPNASAFPERGNRIRNERPVPGLG